MNGPRGKALKAQTCAQRIEAATTTRSQVVISDLAAADAENLFAKYDYENISLLPRGALAEVLRDIGLEKVLGGEFGAFVKLAFDSHSADSHFLSPQEFKQLYYRLLHRYTNLLPRPPALRVTVYSAKNLPPADVNGKADPYCTMQLAGKPKSMTRTRHVEKTLEPKWGEELTGNYAYQEGDDLMFEILDYDRGSVVGDLLCTCVIPNKEFHRPGGFDGTWPMTLSPETAKLKGYNPTLRLRIQVTAFPEPPPRTTILIRHADGLPPADANGKSDPFCSVQLVGKPFSRSSTTIKARTLDPVWNETLTDKHRYEVGDAISFKVWDYDKAGGNDLLGEYVLEGPHFHKPGGFDGELNLQCPDPKYAPVLSVKILVRELEEAVQ
ncbi:RASA4, partial [Symbiodinium microadriaticum]